MSTCERCGKKDLLGYEMVNMCKPCASGTAVATPSASNNSDYVAALRFGIAAILDSVPDTETITRIINEVQRLNAQKDAHCT